VQLPDNDVPITITRPGIGGKHQTTRYVQLQSAHKTKPITNDRKAKDQMDVNRGVSCRDTLGTADGRPSVQRLRDHRPTIERPSRYQTISSHISSLGYH
jgi:hypothetical protein